MTCQSKDVILAKRRKKNMLCMIFMLALSTIETEIDKFANNVDPDEVAHNKAANLDLHCLPSSL